MKPVILRGPKRKQLRQAVSSRNTRNAALLVIRQMESKK